MISLLKFYCPNCGHGYEEEVNLGDEMKCRNCAVAFVPVAEPARVEAAGPAPEGKAAAEVEARAGRLTRASYNLRVAAWWVGILGGLLSVFVGAEWESMEVCLGALMGFLWLALALAVLSRLAGIHASIVLLRVEWMREKGRGEK